VNDAAKTGIQTILERLDSELKTAERGRATAQHDANEAEGAMISRYDTFKEEAQYLMGGFDKRIREINQKISLLRQVAEAKYPTDQSAVAGSLVTVEGKSGSLIYLLLPAGGGETVEIAGRSVLVVTPQSPVGRQLLKKRIDDQLTLPGGDTGIITQLE